MNHAFFGRDRQLFGSFHPATGQASDRAALIVAPLLGENLRSHWALSRTAIALAESGIDVLRIDLSGCGHSEGYLPELGIKHWIEDCKDAMTELEELTGAPKLICYGVRFSGALLTEACSSQWPYRVIAWDPVWSGEQWLEQLENGSYDRFDRLELAGHACSDELLKDLESWSVEDSLLDRVLQVKTRGNDRGAKDMYVDINCDWAMPDLQMIYGRDLVTALHDTGTAA